MQIHTYQQSDIVHILSEYEFKGLERLFVRTVHISAFHSQ